MKSRFLNVSEGQLHAVEWGRGAQLLLAFHGYSNSAPLFSPLAKHLEADFTLVSIDLPGHGKTLWPAGKLLTPQMLVQMAAGLCAEKGVSKYVLTAFSLGGRVALSLFSAAPQQVSHMVLAAPDGLSKNWLHTLALNTGFGERITNDLIQNPERWGKILAGLRRQKLLSQNQYNFLAYHLDSSTSLKRVQEGLLPLRRCMPSVTRLRRQVLETNLPLHLLMGTADTVIPIAPAIAFVKDLPSATLHQLPKSHRLFDEDTVQQMAVRLRNPL